MTAVPKRSDYVLMYLLIILLLIDLSNMDLF